MSNKKNDKKEEAKKENKKDTYKKFVGKKTNDGDKIVELHPKKLRREGQPVADYIQVRMESGRQTMLTPDELKKFVKGK